MKKRQEGIPINIVGAGGFGKEVVSMLPYTGHLLSGLYDDDTKKAHVVGKPEALPADCAYSIAIGNSGVRAEVYAKLPKNLNAGILIHDAAVLQERQSIHIGEGSMVTAGTILTCDIQVGRFTLINLNCTLGHGVRMGDFCSLMPAVNLGGEVQLGQNVYIGTGATLLPGVSVGDNAIVGAGAVVTKDVPQDRVVKGIPAK